MRAFTLNKEELLLRPECQIDTIQHNAVFFLLLYSPFQKKYLYMTITTGLEVLFIAYIIIGLEEEIICFSCTEQSAGFSSHAASS